MPFVIQIDLKLVNQLKTDLGARGFVFSLPPHTLFSAKKDGLVCTLYKSGKLCIQGKGAEEFVEFYLEPELLHAFPLTQGETSWHPHIGIDEAGKGDFFGPLCIGGLYADEKGIQELKRMGVTDSKRLSDAAVIKLGKALQSQFAHQVIQIGPERYNQLYSKFQNLNHLLAWGHAKTIEELVFKTGCKDVLIDQFADEWVVLKALEKKNLNIALTQRTKGESDLVVAAASILARKAFLEGLEKLGKAFDFPFLKGASSAVIICGKSFVARFGKPDLAKVAKVHFKTLDAILEKKEN